jgi:hypothetical protein
MVVNIANLFTIRYIYRVYSYSQLAAGGALQLLFSFILFSNGKVQSEGK